MNTLNTHCPNCQSYGPHEHEHGPDDGFRYCRIRCRECEAETEVQTTENGPPAHGVNMASRWAHS